MGEDTRTGKNLPAKNQANTDEGSVRIFIVTNVVIQSPKLPLELLLPTREEYSLLLNSLFENRAEFLLNVAHQQRLCDDAVQTLCAIVDRPETDQFISSGLEYESADAFAEGSGLRRFVAELGDAIVREQALRVLIKLLESCKALVYLTFLDKSPKDFNTRTSALLDDVKTHLKMLYGIPNHRPSVLRDRDRRLWEMKRMHPDWSWGQLAREANISDGAAELGYKRHVKRERKRLEELHRYVASRHGGPTIFAGHFESLHWTWSAEARRAATFICVRDWK
jgi:hypothetical protein